MTGEEPVTFKEATIGQLYRLLSLLDELSPAAITFLLKWTAEEHTWLAEHDLAIFEARIRRHP